MSEIERVLLAAHQCNAERYRRMLGTRLTDFERQFFEHRLFEEEDAIRQLLAKDPQRSRGRRSRRVAA